MQPCTRTSLLNEPGDPSPPPPPPPPPLNAPSCTRLPPLAQQQRHHKTKSKTGVVRQRPGPRRASFSLFLCCISPFSSHPYRRSAVAAQFPPIFFLPLLRFWFSLDPVLAFYGPAPSLSLSLSLSLPLSFFFSFSLSVLPSLSPITAQTRAH